MLSEKSIQIVKSTVPLLEKNGELLTKYFYNRMFRESPEVAPFFNPSNQHLGTQQRALASAICAYAANIDNLEVLSDAVELIANKHASLRIEPEHYPIVGSNLLESIKEVLGEVANDDVLIAWKEAYEFLANILIEREKQIYDQQRDTIGGWSGFREFRIDRKQAESDNITSFYLVPCDNGAIPVFKPGQYITLRLPTADGSTTMRNYSLSDKPGLDYLRISVKKELAIKQGNPSGFASTLLTDRLSVGDVLDVAPPCGDFFLDVSEKHTRPLVFLAAGVGVTPLLSMLQSALEYMPDRDIYFVHGCLNPSVQAFKTTFDRLADSYSNLNMYYRYSESSDEVRPDKRSSIGFIDAGFIKSVLRDSDADYFFCGPKPFMKNVYYNLLQWGIPGSQVHFEFFGPKEELAKDS